MIVTIFIITGFAGASKVADYDRALKLGIGPRFWDQNILSFTRLENIELIASRVPNLPINACVMILTGSGAAFNIVTRCIPPFIGSTPTDWWPVTST
jgi:hypothetical protein